MEYFKTVSWPNVPVEKLLSIIPIPPTTQAIVRPIDRQLQLVIFKLLDIDITDCSAYNLMLVYFPPHSQINIHSDKPIDELEHLRISQGVILPLKDCEQLVWSWYEATDPKAIFHKSEKGSWKTVPMIPSFAAKEIESTVCDKPFISDIATFHALKNNSDKPAIAISIRLMPWSYGTVQECTDLPTIANLTLCDTTNT